MTTTDKRFWIVIAVFVVIAGLFIWESDQSRGTGGAASMASTTDDSSMDMAGMASSSSTGAPASEASSSESVYTYSCAGGKSISATFHLPQDDFANVNLSDGRRLILGHVISADGARYANASQSIVFWTKGDTAFVTENGTTTYSGCVTNQSLD